MRILRNIADNRDQDSPASSFRQRRFRLFRELLEGVPRPLRILDVGGTVGFWQQMGFADEPGVHITILNNQQCELSGYQPSAESNFELVLGDARSMPQFADKEFDVVFSNSVIEHVGTLSDQQAMLSELRRVAKRYFVQTPNYYFPLEPHFLVPFFQFLPLSARAWLLQRFNLGWTERIEDRATAEEVVKSVRLLTRRELKTLAPEAVLVPERVAGLTKSFIALSGWDG